MLAVLDPSGRAGGDERELAALLDSLEELGSLLHNREVGGEVHVVNAVEAETLYSRDHLALDVSTRLVAEALADCSADRRCGADCDVLLRVGDSVEHLLSVVLFVERADRAGNYTLTAADTAGLGELLLERGADVGIKSAVVSADNADALHILAGCYAAAAEDTLVVITNEERRAFVFFVFDARAVEMTFLAAVFVSQLLKLAGGAAHTGQTFLFVVREHQLEIGLSRGEHLRGVREDLHALVDRIYARGYESARARDFDKAETAGADLVDVL